MQTLPRAAAGISARVSGATVVAMHQQVSGGCPAAMAHWFACPHKGHCEAVEIGGGVIVG